MIWYLIRIFLGSKCITDRQWYIIWNWCRFIYSKLCDASHKCQPRYFFKHQITKNSSHFEIGSAYRESCTVHDHEFMSMFFFFLVVNCWNSLKLRADQYISTNIQIKSIQEVNKLIHWKMSNIKNVMLESISNSLYARKKFYDFEYFRCESKKNSQTEH